MKRLSLTALPLALSLLAAPALAQTPELSYFAKGDYAYLDYSPAGAPSPAVRFACALGQGRVEIAQYQGKPADQVVKVASGDAVEELSATKSSGARGDLIRTRIFTTDPVMLKFRSTGQLELKGDDFNNRIGATGEAKAAIESFFVGCSEGKV